MSSLENLQSLLAQNKIMNFKNLNAEAIDEMLDSRDTGEFENDWLRVSRALEQKQFSAAQLKSINEIRETAYKKTFSVSNHAELASYVADDFELIAKSLLAGDADEWLNALFLAYLQGLFPHAKLTPKKSGLELILETASIRELAV